MRITKAQARRFLLMYHGLWTKPAFKGKEGILMYFRRVGCVQFDPLNIVGFNHELVLQSRIKGFKPEMLTDLLYKDRRLMDGWDKNMAIYPVEDWPYLQRVRQNHTQWFNDRTEIKEACQKVLDEIERRGPLSSDDLSEKQQVNWFWAPTTLARAALESLFYSGQLVIHHKKRTRRFYDLPQRCLPKEICTMPDPFASLEAYYEWYVLRRVSGIGLLWNKAGDGWLGISGLKSQERNRAFASLLEKGLLTEVMVEGISAPLYFNSTYTDLMEEAIKDDKPSRKAFALAPLDNLIWDRRLINDMFGFEYRWEVYKPQDQRQYGYYVLPVLYGDRFVARFEPVRDKDGNLVIKNWWWEPRVKISQGMKTAVHRCLEDFRGFLGADAIINSPVD